MEKQLPDRKVKWTQAGMHDGLSRADIWQKEKWHPLDLRLLDLPTVWVDHDAAVDVRREYARLAHLPLIEDSDLQAQEQDAIPAGIAVRKHDVSIALPRRFTGSRISADMSADGTAHIILQPHLNVISLLGPLVPVLGMARFLWSADAEHRAFLARVSAQSRAFFENGESPILFFLPIVGGA